MQGCPAAQQLWDAHYRSGHWDLFESAEQAAPYLTICELYQRHAGDGTVLDIGCGSGNLYHYLSEHAGLPDACYTGVDVAIEAVRRATARFPGVRIGQRDYAAESVGSRFDCVIFNESLQYFPDPAAALDKCVANNMHACSVLIVAMSGCGNDALWESLQRRCRVVDEREVTGEDGRAWTIRVYKDEC
jgi:2-polyprenyl-3-methyl-5-hydroxy-6-metoxy-1,4-benzoquinol methylase